jgi:hypothetical protein
MILDGSIVANGQDGLGGAGSGGAIYITCGTFSGGTNALLSARGGNSSSGIGGGGGGGRVVVNYGGGRLGAYELYPRDYHGSNSVAKGTGTGGDGQPGTIKWFGPSSRGSIFAVW